MHGWYGPLVSWVIGECWYVTALIIIGYPLLLLVHTGRSHSECFQPITFLGIFLVMITLQLPFTVTSILRTPVSSAIFPKIRLVLVSDYAFGFMRKFGENGIRADSLLASTERTIFMTIRSTFHMHTKDQLSFLPDERLSIYLTTGNLSTLEEEPPTVIKTRSLFSEKTSAPVRRRGNMMNKKKGGFGELWIVLEVVLFN